MALSNWFLRPRPRPNAKIKLLCFPYAGGNASTYLSWVNYLPDTIDLIAVQPPGRSSRMLEAPYSEMTPLIDDLVIDFSQMIDRPYLVFGHSLGSKIAFELMLRCQAMNIRLPEHFIASGSRAAYLSSREDAIYDLPDNELVAELKSLNGTPKEILENDELMELCLPLLRADFKIADTYCASRKILNTKITVLGGSEDHLITLSDLQCWENLFTHSANVYMISGDHFFIESNKPAVLRQVIKVAKSVLDNLEMQDASSMLRVV
ncbi:thioesterase II family protein [Aliikangiella coralliicola]|uniref:Thioesterase n=1 Tax=Aliikangiella coralliicola TaxID=2592383 RepID=A0A545UD66_9GAMM|nr:thioesterase domain-containing protein [Aliikangiella coralliicola]TQV87406.1 thioesterase [Aliikangiella coralliicola]